MGHRIHSTIEIKTEGCTMPHKKRKVKKGGKEKPHKHHYKSEAHTSKHGLFHHVKNANAGVKQEVKVDVKVEQADDCLTSAIKALFGRGN